MASDEKPDDLELLHRWREGDRQAGNHLVRKYHIPVSGFFKNSVSDEEREDLTQATFEKLMHAKDQFEGKSSFRNYLFTIARHTLLDHLRQRYRRGTFEPLTHTVEDIDEATPSQVVVNLQRTQRLLTCLRELPVDTKQLLELYYWQGCTAGDVGEIYGIPPGTVRRRIHDAKAMLRRCLAKECGRGATEQSDDVIDGQMQQLGQLLILGPTKV